MRVYATIRRLYQDYVLHLLEKKTCFLFKLFAEFPKSSALPFHSEEQEIISNEFFHIHASDFIYCEIIPLNVPLYVFEVSSVSEHNRCCSLMVAYKPIPTF